MTAVRFARAPWSDAVVVCGRCARKAGAKGFRKALKRALKASGAKRCRVTESTCLDLCPKRRIVIATAADLAGGRLRVVPPDGADAAAASLLRDRRHTPGSRPVRGAAAIDTTEAQP